MAIGNTNVKFSDLQTEFGGSNPINLSEYYRGGSYFKTNYFNHASYGTPSSSGQIKIGNFRYSANPTINHNTSLNTLYIIDAYANYLYSPTIAQQYDGLGTQINRLHYTSTVDSSAIPDYSSYVTTNQPNVLSQMTISNTNPFNYVKINTFVVPTGCSYVDIEAWGAGGGSMAMREGKEEGKVRRRNSDTPLSNHIRKTWAAKRRIPISAGLDK